jgi:hypothetical protein
MGRRRLNVSMAVAAALGLAATSIALASGGGGRHEGKGVFSTRLIGYQEVPAVNTTGHAKLALELTSSQITFRLEYADLSGPPAVAHIHIGQRSVNGGVAVFFCGGGGKPACPASPSGTVSGTITAAGVVGPAAQGVDPGDLAAVEKAIRSGVAYANMHTAKFPGGEIRGQIRRGHGHEHH